MSLSLLSLILVSVALSASAQIAFKFGATHSVAPEVAGNLLQTFTSMIMNPWVLGGLFMYGLSAALWLLVLARTDVSVAYPFVGLGFIVTLAAGALLLGEQVTLVRVAGTVLVAIGVIMVASTQAPK